MLDCIVRTQRREGFGAFYRSYFTQLSMNIPFQCTHLVTYDLLQSHLNPTRQYNPLSHCLSGALAGALAAAITTPLDVCKTLLNTQHCCNPEELCKTTGGTPPCAPSQSPAPGTVMTGNMAFVRSQSTTTAVMATGLRDAATIIYRTEGLKGFWKGVAPRTIFQIPGTAVSWSIYEYFKHSLNKKNTVHSEY